MDLDRYCKFLGHGRAVHEMLQYLTTILNERDWQLRVTFFEHMLGVALYVGPGPFQDFLAPLLVEQSLYDSHEFVVQRALSAMTLLCSHGLFHERLLLDLASKACPLLCHPSAWIRYECINLLGAIEQNVEKQDTLLDIVIPFVFQRPQKLSQSELLFCLKPAFSRYKFLKLLQAATHPEHRSRLLTLERDPRSPLFQYAEPAQVESEVLDPILEQAVAGYIRSAATVLVSRSETPSAGSFLTQSDGAVMLIGPTTDSLGVDFPLQLEEFGVDAFANLDSVITSYATVVESSVLFNDPPSIKLCTI
jgi:hypothetical protein